MNLGLLPIRTVHEEQLGFLFYAMVYPHRVNHLK